VLTVFTLKLSSLAISETPPAGRQFTKDLEFARSKAVHATALSGSPSRFRHQNLGERRNSHSAARTTPCAPPSSILQGRCPSTDNRWHPRRKNVHRVLLLGQAAHDENPDAGMSGLYVPENIEPHCDRGIWMSRRTRSHSDSRNASRVFVTAGGLAPPR